MGMAAALAGLALTSFTASAQFAGASVAAPAMAADAPLSARQVALPEEEIVAGDVVSIMTLGAPELTAAAPVAMRGESGTGMASGVRVNGQGEITLPFLGTVKIAGMKPSQAAAYLRKALSEEGILSDPQVAVSIVDSPAHMIAVVGEVSKPMQVPAYGSFRLMDAISACGGFTPLASHTVTIHRRGDANPIVVELGVDAKAASIANIPLAGGDTVVVSKVGNIFVVGEVKNALSFPAASNAPMTVMRAITLAGGLKYSAALSKARIYRTNAANQRVQIDFDLKKLMQGKQQDVALASDDILFVPANTFKAIVAAGGVGVAESLFYGATYAEASLK
jgi:polysaccharide export outer membrane protein